MDATAKEIARAMREGLETRRSLGTQPFGQLPSPSFTSDVRHALRVHADLLGTPPIARPGALSWPVRLARRVLKTFLRPWLAVQTRYNQLALDALESLHNEITNLAGRLVPSETRAGTTAPAIASNAAFGASEADASAPVPLLSKPILEYTFVLTHLPAPPARVLLVGSAACGLQPELAGLGYRLNGVDPRPVQSQLATSPVVAARHTCLPFSDGSIDAVVCLGAKRRAEDSSDASWNGQLAEARRVLRPDGRLIITVPFDPEPGLDASSADDLFDTLFPAFRRMQTVFYTECAESCLLTARLSRSEPASMASLTALVVAEKH
jgi:SAM-dependent methyltransferase